MKILHIACIGLSAEGIGSVLNKLVPLQNALGNESRIVSTYENIIYPHLPIVTIKNDDELDSYIDEWRPHVVIFHSLYKWLFYTYSKILQKRSIPYMIQMHGALSKQNYKKGRFKKWIANTLFFNRFIKNANAIIYLNSAERDNCVVNDINSKSIIIPNGCDKVEFLSKNPPPLPLDILYIGRVDMLHKGNDKLIEAIEILKREGYDKCKVSVYANPNDPDLPFFKYKIEKLAGYIEYKGGIYGCEKNDRLRKADIFILTSRYEGMPMGILEALSYGIPCIVTPGTNMVDDICRFNAGWVSTFDSSQIAYTIKKAVDDYYKNYQMLRKNAFSLSLEFDWIKIAEISVRSYLTVLD